MRKIIVPTDFSDAANNAIEYALGLAFFFRCEVELVHILNPATDLNTGYMIEPGIESVKRKKLEKLTAEVANRDLPDEVKIMSSFHLGFPIEEIVNLSKVQDAMVVVGATGETGALGRVFGSIPSNLVRKAHTPVMIVPKKSAFEPYDDIVYASGEVKLDKQMTGLIRKFISTFKARLHSVHIGKASEYPDWHMEAIFGHNTDIPELTKKSIDKIDVVSALNDYCEANKVQLLIMSTRQRGFWDSIIHTSMTREMALHPRLPLLVFHEKDKL